MKSLVKFFFTHFARFVYFLFARILTKAVYARDRLYSYWVENQFDDTMYNLEFHYPIFVKNGRMMSIGAHSGFGRNVVLSAWGEFENKKCLTIGKSCNFGEFTHISAANEIIIGDGVVTGRWVTITDNAHGNMIYEDMKKHPFLRPIVSKGAVHIGNKVWIGDKATILPGVNVGDCAVIGANSVVTKDVPAFSVAVGNPATIIKIIQEVL